MAQVVPGIQFKDETVVNCRVRPDVKIETKEQDEKYRNTEASVNLQHNRKVLYTTSFFLIGH